MIGLSIGLQIGSRRNPRASALRQVLSDAPHQLYVADTGIAPVGATDGTIVTAWSDLSGNGRTQNYALNKRGVYRTSTGHPYLELAAANQVQSTVTSPGTLTGDRVYRWMMSVASATSPGEVFSLTSDGIGFGGTSFGNPGGNVIFTGGGAWVAIGPRKAGKHIYEIRVVNATAQLFVDGVAAASAVSMTITGSSPSQNIGFPGYYVTCDLFGMSSSVGTATAEATIRYNNFMQLVCGPCDP
jgi:hypothetical protein